MNKHKAKQKKESKAKMPAMPKMIAKKKKE
jgi:hypothetical protein